MTQYFILGIMLGYFALLLLISYFTARKQDNDTFFIGNRKSHWALVALGMIGDSLSGVTFISVPGAVSSSGFQYYQVVIGYLFGYVVIAHVLLPLYYRLQLISIYSYLHKRFGTWSQKSGSFFFLISRLVGAAARLFLAAVVLQKLLFDAWDIPFSVSIGFMILLMLVYTFRGGIKSLVWTDSLQSLVLLTGMVGTIVLVLFALKTPLDVTWHVITTEYMHNFFNGDFNSSGYFWKQFFGGAFIALCMTGLDQNMMQKNLSCPNIRDAQKNIYWFTGALLVVNFLFLCMGALLFIYAGQYGISLPANADGKVIPDQVFPFLATNYLGIAASVLFIMGLSAATFSSADSVLTTLTTSFCIDFLNFEERKDWNENRKKQIRQYIHIGFSVLLFAVILGFTQFKNDADALIFTILKVAGFTYGPLLGLFAFGILTKRTTREPWVPVICLISPLLCWWLDTNSVRWLDGYRFGNEILIINGLISFTGLWLCSLKNKRIANFVQIQHE